jgi:hypothetical protein
MTANAMCQRPALSNVMRYDFASGTGLDSRKRTQPTFGTSTRAHLRFSLPMRVA